MSKAVDKSHVDKATARCAAAAKKIHAAMLTLAPSSTLEERFGTPTLVVDDFVFLVKPQGRRAGAWLLREPNVGISDEVYCPGTHTALEAGATDVLRNMLRKCRDVVARRAVQREREATLASIETALPSSARVTSTPDGYGKISNLIRFTVEVPIERGADFAALVRVFHASLSTDGSAALTSVCCGAPLEFETVGGMRLVRSANNINEYWARCSKCRMQHNVPAPSTQAATS